MADASYSPRLRTAVVLCGTGTAGVYQAGVLQALAEAGVKVDVLAGHGPGAANALAAAVDGTPHVWDAGGPWLSNRIRQAYRWRPALSVLGFGLLVTSFVLLSPLVILVLAAITYAVGALLSLLNMTTASFELVAFYGRVIEFLFAPAVVPTVLPRAVVFALLIVVAVQVVSAARALRHESRRNLRGGFWWRLLGAPISADEPAGALRSSLWQLVRGASDGTGATSEELGKRYVDVLTDNLGQPGFREVLVGVHDLDGRRDLVGAILSPHGRGRFETKRRAGSPREAEAIDFTGPQRALLADFVVGAFHLPVATVPWRVQFPADSYWRGERHHLVDRPELAVRLIEEVSGIGAEQIVLVSPAPSASAPHTLRSRPGALRSRIGADVRSIETAAFDDAHSLALARCSSVCVIRPDHNPIGPFDFSGAYDEASDRHSTTADLLKLGYDDAYRCFIEPLVAAGERVDAGL